MREVSLFSRKKSYIINAGVIVDFRIVYIRGINIMFWDRVAGVYDIFVNVINSKTHKGLRSVIAKQINHDDVVLECACGTGFLSAVIAPRCKNLVATDFSANMIKKARKNCSDYSNITFKQGDILSIDYDDESFDVVMAANVIHLLDEPIKAVQELNRVCKPGGKIIIPTYMNKADDGKTTGLSKTIDMVGADFKREFTFDSYQQFFSELGYTNVEYHMLDGRVPCAVAVIKKS